MRLNKLFFHFLVLFGYLLLNGQQSYTDSIYNLHDKLSKEEFIKAVIEIPYDKAVKEMSTFSRLTDLAIKKSEQVKDSNLMAQAYIKKSIALHFSTKDQEAIDLTLKAIQIFESQKDVRNAATSYLELGWKLKRRRLKDAFDYMEKGLRSLEKTNNEKDLVKAYNNFGVLFQMKKIADSALYYHNKSLQLAKKIRDSIGIPFAHTEMAFVLLKNKEFKLAKRHLDSSLAIRVKRNDTYGITDSYLYLGDLYFEKAEYNQAISYFQKGFDLAKANNYFPLKKYAAEYLYLSYEKQKDYKSSFKALKLFQRLKDSVLNKETNSRIAELQIEFETAKKEKEISQQQLKIQKKNNLALALIGGLLVLGLVFWSYFKRQRFKQVQLEKEMALKEALAEIQTKNELSKQRLEISRDLHDNIGSQLTFIISSIENLKYVSKDLNKKFQQKLSDISDFTSDTIHQLRDTIWAMNKSEINSDEFYTRLLSYVEKAKAVTQGIEFEVSNSSVKFVLSSLEGIHLFRILQESINNSIKYARADKISITVTYKHGIIHFSVTDNGIGFLKETVSNGNGLKNMEVRAKEIGASIDIFSQIEKGTKISVKLNKK